MAPDSVLPPRVVNQMPPATEQPRKNTNRRLVPPAAPAATPLPGPPPSRPPPHVTQQVWRANNLGVGLLESPVDRPLPQVTQQQQQPTAANSSSQQPQPTTAAANSNHNLASQSECHQPRPMESAPSNHVASMSGAEQKTQPCSHTQSQPLTTQSRPGTAEVQEWVPPSVHQPPTQQGPQRQVEAVPNTTESVQGVNKASGCKRSGSEKVDQNTTAKCINEKDASSSTSESESESGLFGFVKVLPDD